MELWVQNTTSKTEIENIAWTENFPNDETLFLSNEPNEFDDFLNKLIERDKSKE